MCMPFYICRREILKVNALYRGKKNKVVGKSPIDEIIMWTVVTFSL